MKAILKFNLPEDEPEHKYALAGLDALLVIDEIIEEIRSSLNHDCGNLAFYFNDSGEKKRTCQKTLELVRSFMIESKQERNLPELV
jgi:hypothetical protein